MTRRPPNAAVHALAAGLALLAPSLVLTLAAPPAAAQGAATGTAPLAVRAATPPLREVTVAGAEIRLGDIFAAAGARAGQVVASAPAPGARISLDAPTLARLASAYGIAYRPTSPAERVVIGRDEGILIDSRILAEPILAALARRGLDPDGIELTMNESELALRLPATASLGIERLSYRPPARAFAAVLKVTDGDRLIKRISVSGEIRRAQSVPVPARPLSRGDIIAAADLRMVDADEARLPRNAVVDAAAMVGLVARRDLKPGQVILTKDLAKPVAVEKGAAVTLILSRPGMQLTARGRALADAGVGDVVQVANLQSERIVAGIVTAAGTVTVSNEAGAALPPPRTSAHPRTPR